MHTLDNDNSTVMLNKSYWFNNEQAKINQSFASETKPSKAFDVIMNKLGGFDEGNKVLKNGISMQNNMMKSKQTMNSTMANFQTYNGTANFETLLHKNGDFITINSQNKPINMLMRQSTNYPDSSALIYS